MNSHYISVFVCQRPKRQHIKSEKSERHYACVDWANQNRQVAKAVVLWDKSRTRIQWQSIAHLDQIWAKSHPELTVTWDLDVFDLGHLDFSQSLCLHASISMRVREFNCQINLSHLPGISKRDAIFVLCLKARGIVFDILLLTTQRAEHSGLRAASVPHPCHVSFWSRWLNMPSNKTSFLLLLGTSQWTAPAVSNGRLLTVC